jgi:cystathionine beta-lyase/cystathionine gamma-synthase
MTSHNWGFTTRQLHSDGHDKPLNAHAWPIFQSSTYYFDSPEKGADLFAGRSEGHIYTRLGNPTTEALERVMASLEDADGAVAFSSGMAAITGAMLPFLGKGDHIVSGDTLYGPSIHLIRDIFGGYGIASTFVDSSNLDAVAAAMQPNTKMLFFETPANPTCRVTDIEAAADIARRAGALTAVDNTFLTPYNQKPLAHGADISVYSATKYLNGHGDIVGGINVAREELVAKMRKYRQDTGAIESPFESFLFLRGLRTLSLRMDRHNHNAEILARFLRDHPKVDRVHYPGFPETADPDVVKRQMSGCGSCFSFELKGGFEAGKTLLSSVGVCLLAVSLGTLDTLIQHPASMTHAGVSREMRLQQGLTDGLVRISVGCEDATDLENDLAQALEKVM